MRAQPATRCHGIKGKRLRCALCGSSKNVEFHHVGGRHHVAWFTVPLCQHHHMRVTAGLHQAGVDMRYTREKRERIRRARQATLVFLWILEELDRQGSRQ